MLGYYLDFNVLSAELYGVPEKRRRTIIIGSLIPGISIPSPTRKKPVTVGDVIEKIYARGGKVYNHDIETAQIKNTLDKKRLRCIPEGKGIRYKKDELAYLPKRLRLGVNWDEIRENRFRQTKYYRLDRSLPSPTIMTHRGNYYHPTEDRYLTAREAAKIQSFPNNFEFKGTLSAQWRQIGNAVPPVLAKELGKHILHFLEQNKITSVSQLRKINRSGNSRKTKKNEHLNQLEGHIKNKRGKAFHYKLAATQKN